VKIENPHLVNQLFHWFDLSYFFQLGIKSGLVYNINGLLFLTTFFFARVCMVPYMYYRYAVYSEIPLSTVPTKIPLHCNLCSGAFLLLQCYWFSLIIRSILKTIKNGKPSSCNGHRQSIPSQKKVQ